MKAGVGGIHRKYFFSLCGEGSRSCAVKIEVKSRGSNMSKRARDADPNSVSTSVADLEDYVEELEWIITQGSPVKTCGTSGCWRLVINQECKFCCHRPTLCVVCGPSYFARCKSGEMDEECNNFFCQRHGDVPTRRCDECKAYNGDEPGPEKPK